MVRYPGFPSNKYDVCKEYDFEFKYRKSYLDPQPPKFETSQPGPGQFENIETVIEHLKMSENSLNPFLLAPTTKFR